MPDIDILVPYATKNYVLNPSFEIDDTGWVADGSTTSVVMTRARFERKGLQVVTDGNVKNEGVYYSITNALFKGNVSVSVYVRGAGKIRIRIYDAITGQDSASLGVDIHDNYWQRLEVLGYSSGGGDLRLRVETADVNQAVTFYIDAAQAELGEYVSTYCDGNQDGCRWNGVKHGSISERSIATSEGGRWVSVREPDCSPSTYITTFSGLGLPPITINRQRMALAPGSFFDSIREEERVIQFAVNVKDDAAQDRTGNAKVIINKIRQNLIDMVKPDSNPDNEPFWIRYRDEGKSVMTKVLYESGLEYEGDFRNKWKNSIPLRFLATDPFWYEDSQEVEILSTETNYSENNLLIARINNKWQFVGGGFGNSASNDYVSIIKEDWNRRVYFGGNFVTDDSGAFLNAGYLSDDYSDMIQVASGFDNIVNDILIHPNGKVYFCGNFSHDGDGNVLEGIAEYDPVTDTLSALGSGLTGGVGRAYSMGIDENGVLYVLGNFTDAGGVSVFNMAKWDGSSWSSIGDIIGDLGAYTGTGSLWRILVVNSENIYVGTISSAGITLGGTDYIFMKFDGSNWADVGNSFSDLGIGIFALYQAEDGSIFLGSTTLFKWRGASYEEIRPEFFYRSSSGIITSISIERIAIDKDGLIYASGFIPNFTNSQFDNIPLIVYNNSVWAAVDVDTQPSAVKYNESYGMLVKDNGDIFLGLSTNSSATNEFPIALETSGETDIISKSTAFTYPVVSFSGNGRILWLENALTGEISYINYVLGSNEILELDYRTGKKTIISNYYGSVPNAVLPNSDDIHLAPSNPDNVAGNKIKCFITDEVEPIAQLRYIPTHWSVDAISEQ